MRLCLPALLGLALTSLVGCADRTALIVEVTSTDLAVPTDIDSLTIRAVSGFGAMFEQTYPISTTWPHSLTITPPPSEGIGPVRIEVTGNSGGAFVVRRVVGADFVPGETRRVQVVLTAVCVNVRCPDEAYDCVAGRCCIGTDCTDPDAGVDGGTGDGGIEDAGGDGGMMDVPAPLDVPTPLDVPMSMDVPMLDAGRDAGMDAGTDAGRDAGSDAGTDAPLPPGARLVINEVDYDQDATDTAEYVEIYNAGSDPAPLANVELWLFDGSGGARYGRATFTGTLAPGGYLLAGITGQTLTTPGGVVRVDFMDTTSIQNGPDGVALVDVGSMTILDRFSYESPAVLNALVFGTPTTLVESTAFTTADSTTARSLCRRPNGTDTDMASVDWSTCSPSTPGAANP